MGLLVTPHTNEFIYKEARATQAKLPPDRQRENTPLRDLLDAGVKVGLVTDNVPVSMFWPVWQSIARRDRVTNERVSPEQALTRVEALRCATHNNAFLTFDEDQEGLAGARQARGPRGPQRRSAHRGGNRHSRHQIADDDGRRPDRVRDAELVRLSPLI